MLDEEKENYLLEKTNISKKKFFKNIFFFNSKYI